MELEDALLLVAALALAALAFFVVVVPFIPERHSPCLTRCLPPCPSPILSCSRCSRIATLSSTIWLSVCAETSFRVSVKNENKVVTAFAAAPLVGHAPLCFGMGVSRDAARPFAGLAHAGREIDFHDHEFEVPGPGVLVRVQASAAAPKYMCNERAKQAAAASEASHSQVAVFESSSDWGAAGTEDNPHGQEFECLAGIEFEEQGEESEIETCLAGLEADLQGFLSEPTTAPELCLFLSPCPEVVATAPAQEYMTSQHTSQAVADISRLVGKNQGKATGRKRELSSS